MCKGGLSTGPLPRRGLGHSRVASLLPSAMTTPPSDSKGGHTPPPGRPGIHDTPCSLPTKPPIVFRPDLSKKEGAVFSSGREDTGIFRQISAGGFQFLLGWTRFYAGTSMSKRNRALANLPPSLSRNPKPTRTPARPQGSGRHLDFGEAVAYASNQLPPLSPAPESRLDHHV